MKKLTFALACASTFALFAEITAPKADFESPTYTVGDKVVGEGSPAETGGTFWFYDSTSSSEDSSTVKAYGGDNLAAPTTGDNPGTQYLELSTEGGTLWRSLAAGNTVGTDIANKLGVAQALPAGGLYIDTMVQFTPTEDGGAPEVAPGDKLAIWLNVDSSSGDAPVTNLMVKAGAYDEEGTLSSKSFVLAGATVEAGVWYRLTVEAIDDVCLAENVFAEFYKMPAFVIKLDGAILASAESAFNATFVKQLKDNAIISAETAADIGAGRVFPSLVAGTPGQSSTLQAVGFKGSGALDNLSISETAPSPAPEEPTPVTPQITLSATEATFSGSLKLPTVTVAGDYELGTDYTVSWNGELPTENPSADVVLTVTVTMRGNYSGSNTATFTVKPASTPPVATDWPSDPTTVKDKTAGEAYGFTGDLASAPADKLATWAKANGVSYAGAAGAIKVEAYLLNCANTDDAITEAKADFKIPSITVDANGTVTVTDPEGSYNGVITIKGSETVNGNYTLEKVDGKFPENARFFKAYLSVK